MSAFTFRMAIGAPKHLPLKRHEVADHIESLLAILDRLDGDPDLEPGGDDEPALGWAHCETLGAYRSGQMQDDREGDAGDDGEPDEDREPTLGWTNDPDQSTGARFGDVWRTAEDEDGTDREREDHR